LTYRGIAKNKYRNKKCEYGGHKFDSIGEASRWIWLNNQAEGGCVRELARQVRFSLEINNCPVCVYIADFAYMRYCKVKNEWVYVVEDFKGGALLPEFVLKRKLMLAIHGIDVKIIRSPTAEIEV
jgi:hypothetical protein